MRCSRCSGVHQVPPYEEQTRARARNATRSKRDYRPRRRLLQLSFLSACTLRVDFDVTDSLRRFKAEIFQALAHPTRIAIVEALSHGELSAGQLVDKLGVEQANASQHLSILRAKKIVVNRKAGNQVYYSLRDTVLIEVLDILRRYCCSQLTDTVNMLKEINHTETGKQRKRSR